MEDPILFTLAALAILGAPGPTNALLATAGATGGLRRSLPLIPAEAAGYAISILTIGLVLGPSISAWPITGVVLRAAAAAYLLLLAVRLWRDGADVVASATVVGAPQVFMTTLLNPKAIVFALGIVPFGADRLWPYLLGFLVVLSSTAAAWIAAGAMLGRVANRRGRHGIVRRVGAAAVGSSSVLLLVVPFFG